jgi:hypothetical protein
MEMKTWLAIMLFVGLLCGAGPRQAGAQTEPTPPSGLAVVYFVNDTSYPVEFYHGWNVPLTIHGIALICRAAPNTYCEAFLDPSKPHALGWRATRFYGGAGQGTTGGQIWVQPDRAYVTSPWIPMGVRQLPVNSDNGFGSSPIPQIDGTRGQDPASIPTF